MKPSSNRAGTGDDVQSGQRLRSLSRFAIRRGGGADQTHAPRFRHRVDDRGIVEQPRLQVARRFARWRFGLKLRPAGEVGDLAGPAAAPAACPRAAQRPGRSARLRRDRRCSISTVRPCSRTRRAMMSHSSRRESGSTPTVGSSSSNSSGEPIKRAGKPKLLLHAAGQMAGEPACEGAPDRSSPSARG